MSLTASLAAPAQIKIVPEDVYTAHLANFSPEMRKEIEATYQRIKAQAFEQSPATDNPNLTIVFASTGTGATSLMKRLLAKNPSAPPVVGNAEKFFGEIESFENARHMAQYLNSGGSMFYDTEKTVNPADGSSSLTIKDSTYDGEKAMRDELLRLTHAYLPAGKYMQDRLTEEALSEGRSVIINKRGRTDNGPKIVRAAEKAGAALHTIIYLAPLEVKLAGFKSRFGLHHDIALTDTEIAAEHESLMRNVTEIADATTGPLSLYFRASSHRKGGQPHVTKLVTHPFAYRSNGEITVNNEQEMTYFDDTFEEVGVSAMRLLNGSPQFTA